ncbi:hypothetical protein SAMN05216367_2562 [Tardiphaga sp. OK245]|nr:hypothetical protein SAMN05216367_2562 [Tardiphaga sp. OK245]
MYSRPLTSGVTNPVPVIDSHLRHFRSNLIVFSGYEVPVPKPCVTTTWAFWKV